MFAPTLGRSLTRCLALAAAVVAACDDPQTPPSGDDVTTYDGSYNPAAGSMEFGLETPNGTLSPLVLVATDIVWAPGSGIVSAQVALRNAGNKELPGPAGVAVSDFIPQHVRPLNADCATTTDPPVPARTCVFDHSGTYGDDGVLAPGELSTPVSWMIEDIPGVGFSFRARLVPDLPASGGFISGVVFDDVDRNGVQNPGEPGIQGMVVNLSVRNGPDPVELIERTDSEGRYAFRVGRPGVYPLRRLPARGWEATTPEEIQVVVLEPFPGELSNFTEGHFGVARAQGQGITGSVYRDENRNGQRDPNEPGIAGIEILAWGLECDVPELGGATSDANGHYRIEAAAIGCRLPWFVQRAGIEGMTGTTAKERLLTGPPDNDATFVVDFGLAPVEIEPPRPLITIVGVVFFDRNRNGQRDADEPGLANVPMTLLSPCEVLTRPTFTNPRGEYRFEPHETGFCPIVGVHRGNPDLAGTTPNPFPIDPNLLPGYHKFIADFGVIGRGPVGR
jgi:hypothetical protein